MSAHYQQPLATHPPTSVSFRSGGGLKLMGILNVTPDSFSDGGLHACTKAAVEHALGMEKAGADLLDIGGQSTRPGYEEITVAEEIARILPVLTALHARTSLPLSIDTYKPEVAKAALKAGASILNDIHGFQLHPEMADIAAAYGCKVILMHQEPDFKETGGDTIERITTYLAKSVSIATAAGLALDHIILDPGIGFTKTQQQNLEILGRLAELRTLKCPLLLGASRKSVIGYALDLPVHERLEGTLATTTLAVWQGEEYLRVHDIIANLRAARMAAAIRAQSAHSHG